MAAFLNDPRPLALLLDHGVPADHRWIDRENATLLHHAAAFGRKHVIRLLAERGAPILAVDAKGKTPLQVARSTRHGKDGIPLLTRLTKKAHKDQPAPEQAGDLDASKLRKLLATKPRGFSKSALRGAEKFVRATFAASNTATWASFLGELDEQPDGEVIAACMWLVESATTAKPTVHKHRGGDDASRCRRERRPDPWGPS
jgi:hypothetical protein